MAGVKGRSGGRRPGAGRKPSPPVVLPPEVPSEMASDPKTFLVGVMQNNSLDVRLRMKAAESLMPYYYARKVEVRPGKKEGAEAEALISHRDSNWDMFLADATAQ